MRHRGGPADLVETSKVERNGVLGITHAEVTEIVGGAGGFALAARAIVGQEHHDGVLPLAGLLKRQSQSTDALVDFVDHRGVHGHVAGIQRALVVGEVVPCLHFVAGFVVARWQRSSGRHNAQLDLTSQTLSAGEVPSAVVGIAVALDVFGLRQQRRMSRGMRHVQKERLTRPRCAALADHADGFVGEIVGEEVALGPLVHLDHMVVFDEAMGLMQVGKRLKDSVEPIETALARPPMLRPACAHVVVAAQVPLAHHQRGVARSAKNLCSGRHVVGDLGAVARKAGIVLGDMTHARSMAIHTGEQRSARWRAHWIHMKVGEAHTLAGEPVEVGRVDLAAEATEVAEAHIVDQHEHNIWRTRRRSNRG